MKKEILDKYEMTVGIECHIQLATKTKLFSSADNNEREKSPNSVVSPVDYGLPGMLPVLNREAVYLAVRIGKALNSSIAHISRFDRKHYFYPDLPKGYQISQMYQPIIGPGLVNVPFEDGGSFDVRINHAHLEEDAGKLIHHDNFSLVDLNRAGTPLIEIVSEPDIHSSIEAKAFVTELYRLMTYAGVTHGDLYHGNMRFDVNISTALKGSTELGIRSEVKNLNSFRSVERAAEYEFRRQVELLECGKKIVQETRGWDENKQKTTSQRNKENAQDYRYLPDADIPPIVLTDKEIKKIQCEIPNLPSFYRDEFKKIGFSDEIIYDLLRSQSMTCRVYRIIKKAKDKSISFRIGIWLLHDIGFQPEEGGQSDINISNKISDEQYIDLSEMVGVDKLSSTAAKKIRKVYLAGGRKNDTPYAIANEMDLIQVSNENKIIVIIEEVLNDQSVQKAINDLKNGNEKVIGFLVGQVMKKSGNKANPSLVQKLIRERVK